MSFLASASLIRTHALRARPEVGLMRTSGRSDIWDVQQNGLLQVQFVISRHVGLPRDSIHKIVPDPRGYLWFCASDGLSRLKGIESLAAIKELHERTDELQQKTTGRTNCVNR